MVCSCYTLQDKHVLAFQNYQPTPTLEKYEHHVGIPVGDKPIYTGNVEPLDHKKLVVALF